METSTTNMLGNNITFKTPSGFEVTIREQNGEDDDIISKMKSASDGSAVNKFVANITTDCSLSPGKKLTHNDILKWKNKDKYYIMFKSRIFSLGHELNYKHKCSNPDCNKESSYEENLLPYDRDFSKSPEDSDNGFQYQIKPYPNGEQLVAELALSSGKRVRYKYLNGLSEKKLLEYNKDEISKNTELVVRDIEWYVGEKWQLVQNFREFTAKEMAQIRKHVKENDLPFDALSDCACPYCGTIDHISLMAQPDFFFPQETL